MNFIKQLLFALLALTFIISVPYEVSAAPKKETRKERRERLKREREERKRQKQQKNTQQSKHPQEKKQSPKQDTQPAKQPQPKKITPTFEEKLTPAQVDRKIQTIRKRIETAPENTIPAKDKKVLLEVFDDIVQTPMGRYTFEKAHPDLTFCVRKFTSTASASYSPGATRVNLRRALFDDIHNAKTQEERLQNFHYLTENIIHEATHSIQQINNFKKLQNASFKERMIINNMGELHTFLNESVAGYQITTLQKYCKLAKNGKIKLSPISQFYKDLFDAYKTTGVSDEIAYRSARTKFIETFWQNIGKIPIRIGEQTVVPCDELIRRWNEAYFGIEFRKLLRYSTPYQEAMRDKGIEENLQRFINAMAIDVSPSFFTNPQTSPFELPNPERIICYANGRKSWEADALTNFCIYKEYTQERGELYYIGFSNRQPSVRDGVHTEYHEGTRIKRATYTYKNGKMNGVYREYNTQGDQTMEMPVVNDIPTGEGWILENGVRARKYFSNKKVSHIK